MRPPRKHWRCVTPSAARSGARANSRPDPNSHVHPNAATCTHELMLTLGRLCPPVSACVPVCQADDELERQRKRGDEAEVQLLQLQARITNMVAAQSAAAAQPTARPAEAGAAPAEAGAKDAGAGADARGGDDGTEGGADHDDSGVRAQLAAARQEVAALQVSSARIPRLVQALQDTQQQRDELQVRQRACAYSAWLHASATTACGDSRGRACGDGTLALSCCSRRPVPTRERCHHTPHTPARHQRTVDTLQQRTAELEREAGKLQARLDRSQVRLAQQDRAGSGNGGSGSPAALRNGSPEPTPTTTTTMAVRTPAGGETKRLRRDLARALAEVDRLRQRVRAASAEARESSRIAAAARDKADGQLRGTIAQLRHQAEVAREAAATREARKDATIAKLRERVDVARRQGRRARDSVAQRAEQTAAALMKQINTLQARLRAAEDASYVLVAGVSVIGLRRWRWGVGAAGRVSRPLTSGLRMRVACVCVL